MFSFHHIHPHRQQHQQRFLADSSPLSLFLGSVKRNHPEVNLSLRLLNRLAQHPPSAENIKKQLMYRFLPAATRASIDSLLHQHQLLMHPSSSSRPVPAIVMDEASGILTIGDESVVVREPANPAAVPSPLFYPIHNHVGVMESMLRDFKANHHLLLIGAQGVGKNKIADRFLQLLKKERAYIQLHRDTTVHSLTLRPSLVNGAIEYTDSELVQCIRQGRVLVVDEADKALLSLTFILLLLLPHAYNIWRCAGTR